MKFDEVVGRLESAMRLPLPGPAAQAILAPRVRREWPVGFNPARVRNAAGLLLVFPIDADAHILLTVRSDTLRHAGQVSLPGGVVEPGETFEQAALREAHEEVGLEMGAARTLGALTPIDIPVSGFRLHPIVATADHRPVLRAADGEVARIMEVPVSDLLDPRRLIRMERMRDGLNIQVPALELDAVELWGATAMAVAEFLTLLGWQAPDVGA